MYVLLAWKLCFPEDAQPIEDQSECGAAAACPAAEFLALRSGALKLQNVPLNSA